MYNSSDVETSSCIWILLFCFALDCLLYTIAMNWNFVGICAFKLQNSLTTKTKNEKIEYNIEIKHSFVQFEFTYVVSFM